MSRRVASGAIVLALLILVVGCAGGTGDVTETGAAVTPTAAGSPTPTADHPSTPASTPTTTPDRSERTEFLVTVVRVIDGDTMEIEHANGESDTIRLLGVDTPEVYTVSDPDEWEGIPDTEAGREHLNRWGDEASAFAKSQLESGEEIRIVIDEQGDRRDRYGRLLVYVYDDGELFNLVLIEQGYAQMYDAIFSKRSEFAAAEAAAQNNDIGVWDVTGPTPTSTPSSTPPSSPTETDGGVDGRLEVVEIHENAAGNDHENLNDEYLVFENTGDEALDLSGWRVEDEAEHTYYFPNGFTLAPGTRVILYTGSGDDTDSELYWGSGRAIWNNGGDTVFAYDDSGEIVVEREY